MASTVRLINAKGEQVGVVSIDDALQAAKAASLDLVEIQPNANPPVAKIMDYGKSLFRRSKDKHQAKKKQKIVKVKEMKFSPRTDTADYEVKLKKMRGFLENGDKVKVTVWFKGREMMHQNLGVNLLERVKTDLADCAKVEFFPKLEGKQLIMVLVSSNNVKK